MILNKKTCELNQVDSLIEQLYLQTKQAYFKAQTSDIKENMSPKNKGLQNMSLTSLNKNNSDSKFGTVIVSDPRDSSSNFEISTLEKISGSSHDNFNIGTTNSNFTKSLHIESSDFETLTGDVFVRKSSNSSCEISTTTADFDSKLESLKLEYSKIRRLSLNCDSAIALHRQLGNNAIHSNTTMVSSKCKSKVVVQVLPPIEFGNKFDLLKSGISTSSLGFKPCTFSPIPSMSSLVHQESNPESSLSEEVCVQNVEAETNHKNLSFNEELVLLNSNDKKRKMIEESNFAINDKNMSLETNNTDSLIKSFLSEEKCVQIVEAETTSKNVPSNEKTRKTIDESYSSINEKNISSETNHTDTIMRKIIKGSRGNIMTFKNNGVKLCEIKYIAPKLAVASVGVIRTLHYILYGSYGLTRNEILMCQTIENILQFDGFPFYEESEIFRKKRNLLVNLPSVLYIRIYDILMNYIPEQKQTSLEKLLSFLKQPSDNSQVSEITEEERFYEELKEKALQAHPFVKIQKLDEAFVNVLHQKNLVASETWKPFNKNKTVPRHKQLNLQLKAIPGVAENVLNARRRIINLLHSLLFGRPGSEDINRKNILEFNGFKSRHKNFLSRRTAFLYRLKMKEIEQLCDVVTLPAKNGNKNTKIKKLLNFFSFLEPHQKKSATSLSTVDKPKIKLRDFEKIHTNVECSTPEDLTPLNDLLYVKPCDSSEIHQKILDFSSFTFNISSFDFQYRRTLLHYMNLKTVKQIARILDIEDWENCTNLSELSLRILKFLMDMKMPEKKKLSIEKKYKKEKTHPLILKFHSSNIERRYYKSRSCTPETFDSTYASEEVNDIECEEHTPTSIYYRQNAPSSRFHYQKRGRHDQILNDSTPLLDLMQHPTDKELLSQIDKIINNSSLSITVGELVKEVLNNYPKFDLHYRIDFIKAKALEVLQDLRLSANVFPD